MHKLTRNTSRQKLISSMGKNNQDFSLRIKKAYHIHLGGYENKGVKAPNVTRKTTTDSVTLGLHNIKQQLTMKMLLQSSTRHVFID
jgi:hypothetical protein